MTINISSFIQTTFNIFRTAFNGLKSILHIRNTSLSCPVNTPIKTGSTPLSSRQQKDVIITIEDDKNENIDLNNEDKITNELREYIGFSKPSRINKQNIFTNPIFEIKIPPYIDKINSVKDIHNTDELMVELHYQMQKNRGKDSISEALKDPHSSKVLQQFCKDFQRTPMTLKPSANSPSERLEATNIERLFSKIPPKDASHIYYIAQQGHAAEAFRKIMNIAAETHYLPIQKENSHSINIDVIDEKHYQITSTCSFIYLDTLGKSNNCEIKTVTKTELKFDNNDNFIPNINDTLTLTPKISH